MTGAGGNGANFDKSNHYLKLELVSLTI
jgi:hypothetical protein